VKEVSDFKQNIPQQAMAPSCGIFLNNASELHPLCGAIDRVAAKRTI
jgi:hypothetical protein